MLTAGLSALANALSTALGHSVSPTNISQKTQDEVDYTIKRLAVLVNSYKNGQTSVNLYKITYTGLEHHLQAVILREQIMQNIDHQAQMQAAENAAFAVLGAALAKLPI